MISISIYVRATLCFHLDKFCGGVYQCSGAADALLPGVYLLKIQQKDKMVYKKIIVDWNQSFQRLIPTQLSYIMSKLMLYNFIVDFFLTDITSIILSFNPVLVVANCYARCPYPCNVVQKRKRDYFLTLESGQDQCILSGILLEHYS